MENYNNQDAERNAADLQEWQKDNNYSQDETTGNNVVPPRTPETGGFGLDRENSYDAVNADVDPDRDLDEENTDDDDLDGVDTDDEDDLDGVDTDKDWGNVDPAGGPAPTSPGSAV